MMTTLKYRPTERLVQAKEIDDVSENVGLWDQVREGNGAPATA